MKKLFKWLRIFYNLIPRDARTAITSLMLSCAVMGASLFLANYFMPTEGRQGSSPEVFMACGLEPYIIVEDTVLTSADADVGSVSGDLRSELLARAIDATMPNSEYVVRVAFGAVLLNRVKSSDFPSTLTGVIKSSGINIISFDADIPERTRHAARDALLGVDPTLGALYVMNLSDSRFSEFEERVTSVYGNYAFIK